MSRTFKVILIATLISAVAFRLFFYMAGLKYLPFSSDEAWPSLMAAHMLKGEFPVVYWGQSYMGTQESFFQALLIPVFGLKPFAMRLYPLMFGFLFLWVSYTLARKVYDRTVGLITLVLLAVPASYITICSVVIPPDNYLATTVLGGLSLILLVDILAGEGTRNVWKYAALGFVLGFVFWLHILAVSYIGVAVLFLFLKDKKVFFRKEFLVACVMFGIGAFPLLWYNFQHKWATFRDVGQTVGLAQSFHNLMLLLNLNIHFPLGMKVMMYGDSRNIVELPDMIQYGMAAVWIIVLLVVLIVRFPQLIKLSWLSVKGADGTGVLIALACASIYAFSRSSRSSSFDVRYAIPVISVLPVLFAFGLSVIMGRSRILFAAVLVFVLSVQAWGNVLLLRSWADSATVSEKLELPDTGNLHQFLREHGITHAYAHYWLSYRMSFESNESPLYAEPFNERFPGKDVKFIDEVRAASKVAYITHKTPYSSMFGPDEFARPFALAGGTCASRTIDCFTVFYDFVPPYGKIELRELPRSNWIVSASHNNAKTRMAVDGDASTPWHSIQAQTNGMWFMADLGQTARVCKVSCNLGIWIGDYPRGAVLETSVDGSKWSVVRDMDDVGGSLFWEGSHPRFLVKGNYFTQCFPAVEARYVRIRIDRDRPVRFRWTMTELRVFGPEK